MNTNEMPDLATIKLDSPKRTEICQTKQLKKRIRNEEITSTCLELFKKYKSVIIKINLPCNNVKYSVTFRNE